MSKTIILLLRYLALISILMSSLAVQAFAADDVAKATALLETAQWYFEAKDYTAAQKTILEALAAAPNDAETRNKARQLMSQVREQAGAAQTAAADQQKKTNEANAAKEVEEKEKAKQNQLARLEEAERLSAQGKNDKASETATSILKETNDPDVVKKAKAILEKNQPTASGLIKVLPQRLFILGGWALDVFLGILIIFALYFLMLLLRRVWAGWKRYYWLRDGALFFDTWIVSSYSLRNAIKEVRRVQREHRRWVLNTINDSTSLGLAEAVTDAFSRWSQTSAPASAGLLRLEVLQLPSAPEIEVPRVDVDLAPALDSLSLQIGTINIGTLAKSLTTVKNWLNAKLLWIKGTASIAETQVYVRLTRRSADDKTNTITVSALKADSAKAAEAASYMMYYLIAKETSISEAQAADKLRNGLSLLGDYISGRDPQHLNDAYETFREARSASPALNEAYLYEGIALDLMENHDEARQRFVYLQQNSSDLVLKAKATYNEAVSLFREYNLDDLKRALLKLKPLIDLPDKWEENADSLEAGLTKLVGEPIKALALAAKANAIAHKPIFWKLYAKVPEDADDAAISQRKTDFKTTITEWFDEVKNINGNLQEVLKRAKGQPEVWDDFTRQQLKWAIENSRGNIHLNCAMNYYAPPTPPEAEWEEQRKLYLDKAYDAFQQCEMLLPPGVETLSNLATVLIERQDEDEARTYLQRTITLNPNYEYAYYRLAQSWEKDGRIDEVVKVLRLFVKNRTPGIPGFKNLYSKYSIELARYSIEGAGQVAAAPDTATETTNS